MSAYFPYFPVLFQRVSQSPGATPLAQFTRVPWGMVEPHRATALRNHSQTLERLAERGGLAVCELLAVLEDREWTPIGDLVADGLLERHVANFYRQAPP